jgi:Raf kinase inhibitor-like YbhB/YbcL family protein
MLNALSRGAGRDNDSVRFGVGTRLVVAVGLAALLIGAGGATMELKSQAFAAGEMIPAKYTCDGQDISPPLRWSDPPAGTIEFALISDDPDAPVGTWVHWVMWNIPANASALDENLPKTASLPNGTKQGTTDFRRIGYGGPCPPSGTHRYYFKLYALDTALNLPASTIKKDLEKAMQGHILGQAELMGTYRRR